MKDGLSFYTNNKFDHSEFAKPSQGYTSGLARDQHCFLANEEHCYNLPKHYCNLRYCNRYYSYCKGDFAIVEVEVGPGCRIVQTLIEIPLEIDSILVIEQQVVRDHSFRFQNEMKPGTCQVLQQIQKRLPSG